MKKVPILAVLLALTAMSAHAQFSQLEKDFSQFMLLLGREILPEIQQNDLAGTGIGAASMGDSRFFFSLTGGAVVSNGLLTFVDEENSNFEMLDVYGMIDDNLEDDAARDLYDQAQESFPYPTVKGAFGLRLWDYEFILSGIMLPGAIAESFSEDVEASITNIGLRVRKPVLKESGWLPTVSLGAGYVYSAVHLKYTLDDFTQDYSGQDLTINGDFNLDTSVHSIGFDLGLSKTFLFLTPFFRTSVWYQAASFEADGNFSAQIGTAEPSTLKPSAEVAINDVAVMLSGGLDVNLFLFRLCGTATYNLNTESYGGEIAIRIQF
jgi:hypothetical protein